MPAKSGREARIWRFAINGGGVASWRDGIATRHFGCAARECASLVLMPSDDMAPD